MPLYRDQLGREIALENPPQRIISAVPSLSELLCDLGLKENLVGITVWCVHPADLLSHKPVIGGTKNLDLAKIRQLQPDLIICNKEENVKDQIEELSKDFPVWVSDVRDVESALQMIQGIGDICRRSEEARALCHSISGVRKLLRNNLTAKFLYFIWKDPWMVAGPDTFISALLSEMGLENACPESGNRYPALSPEQIADSGAEILLLSSEPYAFGLKEAAEIQEISSASTVKLVDGELFSWYGSRILLTFNYLRLLFSEFDLILKAK